MSNGLSRCSLSSFLFSIFVCKYTIYYSHSNNFTSFFEKQQKKQGCLSFTHTSSSFCSLSLSSFSISSIDGRALLKSSRNRKDQRFRIAPNLGRDFHCIGVMLIESLDIAAIQRRKTISNLSALLPPEILFYFGIQHGIVTVIVLDDEPMFEKGDA